MADDPNNWSALDVVSQCIAHLNADEFEDAARLIAPDAINHTPDGDLIGRDAFVAGWKSLKTAFPDWTFTIVEANEADGRVMCRYRNSGTQRGEFADHPATGRSFVALGLDCVHVASGRVIEHWALLDLAAMGQQLGWE